MNTVDSTIGKLLVYVLTMKLLLAHNVVWGTVVTEAFLSPWVVVLRQVCRTHHNRGVWCLHGFKSRQVNYCYCFQPREQERWDGSDKFSFASLFFLLLAVTTLRHGSNSRSLEPHSYELTLYVSQNGLQNASPRVKRYLILSRDWNLRWDL